MPSVTELPALFKEGKLGELLAQKFHGKLGPTFPMKDCNFLITFPSDSETPSSEQIGDLITAHFVALGYKVEPNKNLRKDRFEAIISYNRESSAEGCSMGVTIDTRYPFNNKKSSLHAICQVLW